MDGSLKESQGGSVPIDPWKSPQDTAKEIKDRHQSISYIQIVGENRVLFLAEKHNNHPIRRHLVQYARDIKAAGITHYAIEAKEEGNAVFERLNKGGESVDLSKVDVGPGGADYEETIRAMVAQGIKIVAIDIDQSKKPSGEEREAKITENIEKILQLDPNAKVAVLIGAFHTSRRTSIEGVRQTGSRLMELQIPAVNVRFAGGEDDGPTMLTGAVSQAGLASQEFMLDFRPYANSQNVPYGKGEVDWVVHLPQ